MGRGESIELVKAREFAEKYNADVIRSRDGFVIVYKRECKDNKCKRILLWFRKSPITEKAVRFLKRTLNRLGHDEVWLIKLYKEPDFTEEYQNYIDKIIPIKELEDYMKEKTKNT